MASFVRISLSNVGRRTYFQFLQRTFTNRQQPFGINRMNEVLRTNLFSIQCVNFRYLETSSKSRISLLSLLELPSKKATNVHEITKDAILPTSEYDKLRKEFLKLRNQVKLQRRFNVGKNCSITFENYDLMWFQVQEMLWIEKGGDAQLKEELKAYNPMIPKGNNLPFTMMLAFKDVEERRKSLAQLGWIEDQIFLLFDGHKIRAVPTDDSLPRTTNDGKTSAVHFLMFPFKPDEIEAFKKCNVAKFSIEHKNYNCQVDVRDIVLENLKKDLKL